jgi:hypothetical protein
MSCSGTHQEDREWMDKVGVTVCSVFKFERKHDRSRYSFLFPSEKSDCLYSDGKEIVHPLLFANIFVKL